MDNNEPDDFADPDYWYRNRDKLECGQVFRSYDGSLVKLDGRVPGDGTRWYVGEWDDKWGWSWMDATAEPGDFRGPPLPEPVKSNPEPDFYTLPRNG